MSNHFPIFGLLKKPSALGVFLTIFTLVFYGNYYLMSHLAGSRDSMCVLGGALTFGNIFFALTMSLLAGFVVIAFIENIKKRSASKKITVGSASFLGLIFGTLTSFCTLCTLPVISLFGFSVGLSAFTDYQLYFKAISLLFLMASLYFVNRELIKGCARCVS